jgi:FixJ family two-component response regulator
VFYADGERASTGTVRVILNRLGLEVTEFDRAVDCLDCLRMCQCHLLISNPRRPSIEGMELLRGARRVQPSVPVIVLVDHGDIEGAVRAMKAGAADCLERPPERQLLVSAIDAALRKTVRLDLLPKWPLTEAEDVVLNLMLEGRTTSDIALRLHRSRRIVEVHRSHIMRKLEVKGMVDLVRTCVQMGVLQDWPRPERQQRIRIFPKSDQWD